MGCNLLKSLKFLIFIYYIIIILLLWEFFTPTLTDSFLLEFEWQKVSLTPFSILADLSNDVVWMVSTCSLISKSSSPFTNPLGIVPSAPTTIGITVMFHSFFSSLARYRLFYHYFQLWCHNKHDRNLLPYMLLYADAVFLIFYMVRVSLFLMSYIYLERAVLCAYLLFRFYVNGSLSPGSFCWSDVNFFHLL